MRPFVLLAGCLAAAPLAAFQGQGAVDQPAALGHVSPHPAASYVGTEKCRECHAATHSSWTNGRHSKMLQPASPRTVIPVFEGSVTLHGKDYRLGREGDAYFITERYLQQTPVKRKVDYTLGSRRVQHFLSRLPDGRIVVLPPSFDVEKKEWFHNLDIVDLEETGEVKVQVWNVNCFGCHVSGEDKGFDPQHKTFATTWTDFGTSCERCHGPGLAHATKYARRRPGTGPETSAESPPPGPAEDTLIVHPRRLDPETSTTLCAQCHSLRDITRVGFSGGSNYYDYFTPLLEYSQKKNHDPAYWPNGRPRRFSNEGLAFWQSQCFFKGGATCLSCHTDVHEPNIEKNDRLALKQNGLCAGCHARIVQEGSAHSHHAVPARGTDGPVVSCVSCHMPRTVISLRHRMPDHTISLPAPENTKRFGIPNACNECHKDRTPDWAEARLAEWFPAGRRQTEVEDALAFSLGAKGDPAGLDRLLKIAGDPSRPPLFRANALGHLRRYPEARASQALLAGASDAHPALRLAAVLSLVDRAREPEVRKALEAGLADARRTVRMASALGVLDGGIAASPALASSPRLAAALSDHALRAHFLSEDPLAQLDLGKLFFLAGQWKSAESSVRDALRLDPKIAGGHYFLGLATLGQGRVEEGAALLRRVDPGDPHRKDADAVLARLKSP